MNEKRDDDKIPPYNEASAVALSLGLDSTPYTHLSSISASRFDVPTGVQSRLKRLHVNARHTRHRARTLNTTFASRVPTLCYPHNINALKAQTVRPFFASLSIRCG
jgi:hypothetical protein